MTANAFTSVSLEPPVVLVSVDKRTATWRYIVESRAFAVNILSGEQEHLARRFAGPHRTLANPFADIAYSRRPGGAPLLRGVLAWLDCTLFRAYDGGDHSLFLGAVRDWDFDASRAPLLFYRGAFVGLRPAPHPNGVVEGSS
jgi:flavin reductase (DIM6/NTAB) family NADH-FMN oxidoreductase RutF